MTAKLYYKKVTLNFEEILTQDDLHNSLVELFGFPDFYGRNVHAAADCLFSMLYPEDGMTTYHLQDSTNLLIEVANFLNASVEVKELLLAIVTLVNMKWQDKELTNSIILKL